MTDTISSGSWFSGMSGLAVPFPKYQYPVEFQNSSRLTYYASLFKTIEINQSFYKLPKEKTLIKWSNEVPADFKFTFKLWKQITHAKGLHFSEADVADFMQVISNVGDKRGCLLIQFPASVKSDKIEQFAHLLSVITSNNSDNLWKVAVEFRDSSWYSEDLYELMNQHDATIVIHDKPAGKPPTYVDLNSTVRYLRFHGPRGDYRGSYDEGFLHEYASYIKEGREAGHSVFVYFNNTNGDGAYNNLKELNRKVDEELL